MKRIVGNGLIAKSLAEINFTNDCLILASGVSNSGEQRESEFQREIEIVKKSILENPSSEVIYFSTCSVYQKNWTRYIHHKMEMEALIAEKSSTFYIYRLPQLVGLVRNSTLVSYLVECVLEGRIVKIQSNAKRNILDVRDAVRLFHYLVENSIGKNTCQNLASVTNISVFDILLEIAKILNKKPIFDVINTGESYQIPLNFLMKHFGPNDPVFLENYWQSSLARYVPLLSSRNV